MTKEAYLEMCEALGSEPVPSNVVIQFLPRMFGLNLQAVECYGMLSENWSAMGTYLGKNLADLLFIMEINKVEDYAKEYVIDTVRYIDSLVAEDIARKQKQQSKKNG